LTFSKKPFKLIVLVPLMTRREIFIEYAMSWLGQRYIWAGDGPLFDCSGFDVECLKAVGVISPNVDYSAAGLFDLFKDYQKNFYKKSYLAFWMNQSGHVTHTEILIDGYHTIGASGGGRPEFDVYKTITNDRVLKSFYPENMSRMQFESYKNEFIPILVKEKLSQLQADEQNAFIKIRPIGYRGDNFLVCDPFGDEG